MIRILSVVVVLALLLSSGIAVPVTAQGEVTVSINVPGDVEPGGNFTATVDITQVTDFDAANYDVSFDSTILRLDNVTNGNIGGTSIPVEIGNEIGAGIFTIVQNVPGLTGVNGSGYLAVLHFSVIGSPGEGSNINLFNGVLSSKLAQAISATWVGDSVIISPVVEEPEVTVSINAPPEVISGGIFTATADITQVTDFDAANYDVSFDSTVLRLDNVTSGDIGGTSIPVGIWNEIDTGTFTIVQNVPGLTGVNGSGYLAVLHFSVIGSPGEGSNINLSNGVLSSNSAQAIPATWIGDSVNLTDISPPVVTTENATDITTNSAALHGTLDSLGAYSSANVSFVWGTTSGSLTQETTPEVMTAIGSFTVTLSSLCPGTTYYFRAKATANTTAYGYELSFTTSTLPPTVATNDAANITSNSAVLNGSLVDLGSCNSANFSYEWGANYSLW
ncbi:cohesin domain-containing protein [Chloroflexota bacterium]